MRALDSHALGIIRRRFSPYLGLFLFIASRRNRLCLQPERWTGKFSRTLSTSEPPHRTQCWHHHRPHPGPYHALAADDFFRVHRRTNFQRPAESSAPCHFNPRSSAVEESKAPRPALAI